MLDIYSHKEGCHKNEQYTVTEYTIVLISPQTSLQEISHLIVVASWAQGTLVDTVAKETWEATVTIVSVGSFANKFLYVHCNLKLHVLDWYIEVLICMQVFFMLDWSCTIKQHRQTQYISVCDSMNSSVL